jgi:hypothetical protein
MLLEILSEEKNQESLNWARIATLQNAHSYSCSGRDLNPHRLASLHRYFPMEIVQNNALTRKPFVLNCPKYDDG